MFMEITICPWKIELYQTIQYDPLLFLQEHVVLNPLNVLWFPNRNERSIPLRRILHQFLQYGIHCLAPHDHCNF